jgi:hypothetical protein
LPARQEVVKHSPDVVFRQNTGAAIISHVVHRSLIAVVIPHLFDCAQGTLDAESSL